MAQAFLLAAPNANALADWTKAWAASSGCNRIRATLAREPLTGRHRFSMLFPSWLDQKGRAKQKLKVLQMLTHSGVIRPAGVELRHSHPLVKGPSAIAFEDRIPYGFYLSGKSSHRK